MSHANKPFRYESGQPIPDWVGRTDIGEVYDEKLLMIREWYPARGMMILGMHGMGKSALLRKLQVSAEARNAGMTTHFIDASQGDSVIKTLLHDIVRGRLRQSTQAGEAVGWTKWQGRKVLGFLYKWLHKVTMKQLPEPPRFFDEFTRFGKGMRDDDKRMVVFIDDLHLASPEDLRILASVFQTTEKENLPFLFVVAGHRSLRRKLKKVNVYGRDILDEHELQCLSQGETYTFLARTATRHGRQFSPEAMAEIYRISQGYPSLLQLSGWQVWKDAGSPEMTEADVIAATPRAFEEIGKRTYMSIRERLGKAELGLVLAMASLPAAERTLENIFQIIGGVEADHAPAITNLREANIVYLVAANQLDFKAPLFDKFLLEFDQSMTRFD